MIELVDNDIKIYYKHTPCAQERRHKYYEERNRRHEEDPNELLEGRYKYLK